MDEQDDRLAEAVCRCWAEDRCPDALRRRVAGLIAAERARNRWARFIPARISVAAAVALLIGGGYLLLGRPGPSPAAAASVLPVAMESELVQTHDHCCCARDHQHLPVSRSNSYAIAANLRCCLARPVMVSHPSDPAWQFAGASVCPVGGIRSAHLVFRRSDGDALSVFSLPRSVAPTAVDGQQFQIQSGDHPIVGFVRHGAVYCLVGSGCRSDVSVAQLSNIRRQMEQQVVVADAIAVGPTSGELMHATGR